MLVPQPTIADCPVFIIGAPRSGTSMLHWALCQHDALWGSEESDFLRPMIEGALTAYTEGTSRGDRHWLVHEKVDKNEFLAHVGLGLNALYTAHADGRRWVEQTPSYTLCADGLAQLFPTAQFLVLSRDGRQVVESSRAMMQLSHRRACKWWRLYTDAARDFQATHPERCLQLRFEDLLVETAATLGRTFEFLGLEPIDAATKFITEREPINAAPGRAGESSGDKLAARWHRWSGGQRRMFLRTCGPALRRLGYEADDSWASGPRS